MQSLLLKNFIIGFIISTTIITQSVATCSGSIVTKGKQKVLELADKSIVTYSKMSVNIDGAKNAYHPNGYSSGSLIHLCNAGQVYLPDGTKYHGAESNKTCTGKFLTDIQKIGNAGWDNPNVGLVRWYGILGTGSAIIKDNRVKGIKPVLSDDKAGFYISTTSLKDNNFPYNDQRRYVDPLTVPYAVVKKNSNIKLGTLGVAWRTKGCKKEGLCNPIPFIVADIGPSIGEGSIFLTRSINGLDTNTTITHKNKYDGHVADNDVLYVFFNGNKMKPPYNQNNVNSIATESFNDWGGNKRLRECLSSQKIPNTNN